MSDLQKHWEEAIQDKIDYEQEIFEHNKNILKNLDCDDFKEIIDGCDITGKMEWVDAPKFKPENKPDVCGIFTLEFVDQWSVGDSGDSYEGFMYIHIIGYDRYLKVPYYC